MKSLFTIILSLSVAFTVFSQTIDGTPEIKKGRAAGNTAEGKLKKASKRIYINEFRVFYQVVYFDSDYARAGYDGGGASGHRSAAQASLSVALDGVDEQMLTDNTTRLYNEYVSQLKSEGYEIITTDEAGKVPVFEEYERIQGGTLNTAQMVGYLMSTPKGYDYFVKKVNNKGKEKKAFIDIRHKVSNELNGALIVNVEMTVPFMVEAESKGSKMLKGVVGGLAKVVASPYFRLSGTNTNVSYVYSTNKFGPEAYVAMPMKKDIQIKGVFDESQKFKTTAKAENNQAYDAGAWTIVIPADDVKESNIQFVSVDTKKYVDGAYMASKSYLDAAFARFKEVTGK